MTNIDPADAHVAARVMTRICEVDRMPLDAHLTADYVRRFRPRARENQRNHVDTAARVLDALTEKTGRPAHTIVHVGHYDLGFRHYSDKRQS